MKAFANIKSRYAEYKALDSADKVKAWKEGLINNAIYLLIIIAVIYTYTQNSRFLSVASIVNIISLSAANIPIACGIAGTIVLTGTDLSAGRVVGLTACISASLLQSVTYATKIFPDLPVLPIPLVILIVIVVGGIVGWVNGFFVAKFHLHPFIVTLATQLIVYGILLMYIMLNGNNGQPLSGLDKSFKNFVTGSFLKIRGVPIPNYVWYACVVVVFMWFMWNKTTFGKNMFAVGSNPEAANVSGVNVMRTTILVHTLAGCMYGITGFIESARIGSNQANTGLNYECDAIAACVIGGVSFVGGTGKISGVVLGVFILRIIFVALQFLAVSQNMQYVIKGLIILIACAIDMGNVMDENKMPENDGWKKNARLVIYAMAGFYLLTLAYQMFRAISTSHGNEQLVMIVATILFLIVGVGLIGFGTINVYKNMKKNQSTDKDRNEE